MSTPHQDGIKYPQRAGEVDCRDYLRMGRCKYGESCKYHHPPNVQIGGGIASSNPDEPPFPIRPGEPICQYYLKHATCKFGQSCKFHHPESSRNTIGGDGILPQRPGEPECIYFLRNGRCKYGSTCKYHHPVLRMRGQSVGSIRELNAPYYILAENGSVPAGAVLVVPSSYPQYFAATGPLVQQVQTSQQLSQDSPMMTSVNTADTLSTGYLWRNRSEGSLNNVGDKSVSSFTSNGTPDQEVNRDVHDEGMTQMTSALLNMLEINEDEDDRLQRIHEQSVPLQTPTPATSLNSYTFSNDPSIVRGSVDPPLSLPANSLHGLYNNTPQSLSRQGAINNNFVGSPLRIDKSKKVQYNHQGIYEDHSPSASSSSANVFFTP